MGNHRSFHKEVVNLECEQGGEVGRRHLPGSGNAMYKASMGIIQGTNNCCYKILILGWGFWGRRIKE